MRYRRFRSNFPTTVGVEYTFVPKMNTALDVYSSRLVGMYAAQALKKSLNVHYSVRERIHDEDGAVEVSSPVHRNRGQLISFAGSLFGKADSWKLTPRHVITNERGDETYIGTGGGHVHVGIPKGMTKKQRALFMRNVAVDSFNRVELNWLFQEWHEDEAVPNWIEKSHPEIKSNLERVISAPLRTRSLPIVIRTAEALHIEDVNNTLEFRLFDAPRDLSMVERNVDFALAYTMYHKRLAVRRAEVGLRKREVINRKKMSDEQVRRKLETFFRRIGLRYGDYHETYWPNYTMRKEYGQL